MILVQVAYLKSDTLHVLSGVPQESIIVSLLYRFLKDCEQSDEDDELYEV